MRLLSDPQITSGYLIEDPFPGLPQVTHCGEAVCVQNHQLCGHTHPFFELIILTRGRATWTVEGRTYEQEPGDLFLTFPGQVHGTGPRPNPENQHLWIGLDLKGLSRRGTRLGSLLEKNGRHIYRGGAEMEPLLRGLIAQAVSQRKECEEVARRYLETLVALFMQQIQAAGRESPTGAVPRSLPIQRCLAYMELRLSGRLSLEALARVAAIRSTADFCKRFRKEVGLTPAAMHLRMRLDSARDVLAGSHLPITDIALQFGFSSSQHFSGRFKEAFGLTPTSWRKKSRGGREVDAEHQRE